MAYDARAIANFILTRCHSKNVSVTQMTLLKTLYFAHAWFLVKKNTSLVAQPFEAWKFGPVLRVVYEQTKIFGSKPITELLTKIDIGTGQEIISTCDLSDADREFISSVVDFYVRYDAFTLSDLTHEKDSPWHKIWEKAGKVAVPGMVIPNQTILDWFAQTGGRAMFVKHLETENGPTADASRAGTAPH